VNSAVRRSLRLGKRIVRKSLRVAAALTARGLEAIDPFVWIARLRMSGRTDAVVVCVYRHANAASVYEWASAAASSGADVRLWALDRTAPILAPWTVGEGPGGRFQNLNRALAATSRPNVPVVVLDDDVSLTYGSLAQLVNLVAATGLDLAQPAHRRGSNMYWAITLRHPLAFARETTFVEIGPLVVVMPRIRDKVLPFPEEGMGWGTEILWSKLRSDGFRLGVIDALSVYHWGPIAAGYNFDDEFRRMSALMSRHNVRDMREIQHTVRSIRSLARRQPGASASDVSNRSSP